MVEGLILRPLMRDDRVNPVPEPRLWPDATALLSLQQFGIEHAGINDAAGGDAAAGRLLGIEGAPRFSRPGVVCPDLVFRDSQFFMRLLA